MKNEYDLDSAVTFLLVGLGIGSILALVFNPKQRGALAGTTGIDSWRAAGLRLQKEDGAEAQQAKARVA
jgi:hypothetical protein